MAEEQIPMDRGENPEDWVSDTVASLDSRKSLRDHPAGIRIPISGKVRVEPIEAAIIDTQVFQRLRSIRQLGGTYLVYPGASHSRFEHSIGVLAMAEKMLDALRYNSPRALLPTEEDTRIIRLTALLHDIGHLPYGHTLEDEIGLLPRHDSKQRIEGLFGTRDNPEHIRILLEENGYRAELKSALEALMESRKPADRAYFRKDIVSNTICADLLDYLRRDMYHLGLTYDYDDRLFEYMTLARDKSNRVRFAINLFSSKKFRHDAITQILEILNLRYILNEAVLYHHAKDAHSAMLSRALLESNFLRQEYEAAVEALPDKYVKERLLGRLRESRHGEDGIQRVLEFDGTDRIEIPALYSMTDDTLIKGLARDENEITRTLIAMIESRQLYCVAETITYEAAEAAGAQARIVSELHEHPSRRYSLERQIEIELELPRGTVLLYCPAASMNAKLARVHVVDSSGEAQPLESYEAEHGERLTGGFLAAQMKRFKRLWRSYLFMHPAVSEIARERARKYIRAYFHLNAPLASQAEQEEVAEKAFREIALQISMDKYPHEQVERLLAVVPEVIRERGGDSDRVRRYLNVIRLELKKE